MRHELPVDVLPPPDRWRASRGDRRARGLYWIDETEDIPYSATRAGRDGRPLREILRPWMRDHVFAVYDPDDRAPLLVGGRRRVAERLRGR